MLIIKNWNDRFENNRSRELRTLNWFPMPNRLDNDLYSVIMELENGAGIFGATVAILCVASRCQPRGHLVRENGAPHDATSLSRMTRVPLKLMQQTLHLLATAEIGLLDKLDKRETTPVEIATEPADAETAPDPVIDMRMALNALYGRQPEDKWSYEEEHSLFELTKRPSVLSELEIVRGYRLRLPAADRAKFFPQSVVKLLKNWTQIVDQARGKSAPPSLTQREAKRSVKEAERL